MNSIIFDLIILDIMMPGKTGLQFLKEIRKNSRVPILMLTAMSSTEDRIDGLETGADDYLSKPFQPKELLLRIKNILKRNSYINKVKPSSNLEFGPFFFNMDSLNLYKNGLSIHLTTSEQNLFNYVESDYVEDNPGNTDDSSSADSSTLFSAYAGVYFNNDGEST